MRKQSERDIVHVPLISDLPTSPRSFKATLAIKDNWISAWHVVHCGGGGRHGRNALRQMRRLQCAGSGQNWILMPFNHCKPFNHKFYGSKLQKLLLFSAADGTYSIRDWHLCLANRCILNAVKKLSYLGEVKLRTNV